jgi:Uma2 family endonuclease
MSMPVAKVKRVSAEEYLKAEELSAERHEYHDGEVLMMAGGTYRHSVVITNSLVGIQGRLKGKPCRASEANTRVVSIHARSYVYPDITVVCGEPQFDPADKKQSTITNPTLVVEVVSESTEAYDRGDKFSRYRECVSLKQYVLISTTRPEVETYLRRDDGTWVFSAFSGLDAVVTLSAIGVDLPLSEVYDGVTFADDEPPPT